MPEATSGNHDVRELRFSLLGIMNITRKFYRSIQKPNPTKSPKRNILPRNGPRAILFPSEACTAKLAVALLPGR
jgi:hypothetical protein